MITIEEASRSVDIMIGIFILTMLGVIALVFLLINHIEQREHRKMQTEVERVRREMEQTYKVEKTRIGSRNFVKLYEANETIKDLQERLRRTEKELERLKTSVERWSNGQK